MKVSLGFSQAKDNIKAANEAVGQALVGLNRESADLAIIFTTIELANTAVLKTIVNILGEISLIGCSSSAVIAEGKIHKYGLAIALISLDQQAFFNTAFVKDISRKTPLEAGRELGEKLLYGCKDIRRNLSLIFSDGLIDNSTALINGLQERLGKSFPLLGAGASDNFAFAKTYQFFNQEVMDDACCGMLWGGKFNFGFGIGHGWKPLGKERCVTKSAGNLVQEIDSAPAVKLYESYLDENFVQLGSDLKRISVFYPLGINIPGESEYLLRNVTAIKDDSSLITRGDVPQGSMIRIMIGTKESCLDAAAKSCQEAKKGLCGKSAKLVFIFISASRLTLLGRQAEMEIEIAREIFGAETPIFGIYTYGEEAPLKSINYLGKAYFHNQSVCVLAMGEEK